MGPQEAVQAVQVGADSVVIVTRHMTPITFFAFQLLCFATGLGVMRVLLKFSWLKSLWISAGFASVASILFMTCMTGVSLKWSVVSLSFLPIWIVAAVMIIRTVVSCFGDVDDSGKVNSAERRRTLEMVEQGKISSEEGRIQQHNHSSFFIVHRIW